MTLQSARDWRLERRAGSLQCNLRRSDFTLMGRGVLRRKEHWEHCELRDIRGTPEMPLDRCLGSRGV
jgi:hypothetical protein